MQQKWQKMVVESDANHRINPSIFNLILMQPTRWCHVHHPPSCLYQSWGQTEKHTTDFKAKPKEIVAIDFDAKPEKTVATGFETKPKKTITSGFEVKPEKTVTVVLRPNHWQTVNFGFEAQPRNSRSSYSRVWCRPHTALPDLSIV
jgi:hypothetical protein